MKCPELLVGQTVNWFWSQTRPLGATECVSGFTPIWVVRFFHNIPTLSSLAHPNLNIYMLPWSISALSSLCAVVSKFLSNLANPRAPWPLPFCLLLPYLCSRTSARTHVLSLHFPFAEVAKSEVCVCPHAFISMYIRGLNNTKPNFTIHVVENL